ncbi:MAG TPA: hypothetical protein VMO26_18405 [Vicinamibacterales bacterium]|nr:hypothetical protein [Vicinamibacterales bacterium]
MNNGIGAAVVDRKDRSFNVDLCDLSPVGLFVPAYEYTVALDVLGAHVHVLSPSPARSIHG